MAYELGEHGRKLLRVYVEVLGLSEGRPADLVEALASATSAELQAIDRALQAADVNAFLAAAEPEHIPSAAPVNTDFDDVDVLVFDENKRAEGLAYLASMMGNPAEEAPSAADRPRKTAASESVQRSKRSKGSAPLRTI